MAYLEIDLLGMDNLIRDVSEMRGRAENLGSVLAREGQELKREVIQNLTGAPMPALSPVTQEIRSREHTGGSQRPLAALVGSIQVRVDGGRSVSVFSTFPWAERLQVGGTNARVFGSHSLHRLPPRPFFPVAPGGLVALTMEQETAFSARVLGWIVNGTVS